MHPAWQTHEKTPLAPFSLKNYSSDYHSIKKKSTILFQKSLKKFTHIKMTLEAG